MVYLDNVVIKAPNKLNHMNKKISFLSLLLVVNTIKAQRDSLLPFSKGPGPLFSFGLNVQPKNNFVYRQIYTLDERNLESRFVMHNHVYYGLSHKLTFIAKQPVILKRRTNGKHSRGLGNARFEIETIPYVYQVADEYRFRITTVTGVIPPTTTSKATTQLTLHSNSYFLGITQSNTTPKIFQYGGIGIFIPTTKKSIYYGCRLYYELGFAHAIINNETLFFGVDFEMSGEYQQSRQINGVSDFTTGSNMIFFGPSARLSTEHFIGQIGLQYPWIRHVKVINPNKTNYRFACAGALSYTF